MQIFILPCLAILLLNGGALHAQQQTQQATVQWGEDLNLKKDGRLSRLVGGYKDDVIQLMVLDKEFQLQRMSMDLSLEAREQLELEFEKNDLSLERIMIFGDRILAFTSFYNKKADKNNLFLRTYDATTLKPVSALDKVTDIDATRRSNTGSFGFRMSPDSSKVLVYYLLPYEKDAPEKFGLKVLDAQLATIWEREVTLPYADKDFGFEGFRLDDDGSVICMGVKYQGSSRETRRLKRESKTYYEYHMLVYKNDGATPKDYKITLGERFLQDMTVAFAPDGGDIICAGFYSEKGTWSIRGAYFLTLDRTTKEVKTSTFKQFSEDFITMYMTDREEKKAKKKADRKDEDLELYEYELRDIVLREDGGAVLIAEQYYWYVTTTTYTDSQGNRQTRTIYHYIYNDIIAVSLSAKGEIDRTAKVPKRQHTTNDGGYVSSFSLAVKDDKMYFIFNDNGKNLSLAPGEKIQWMRSGKKETSIITLATIDIEGRTTREALLEMDKRDMVTIPKECIEVDDQLFLYAQRKKGYKFGVASFR